mmetsp:Transcript_29989/g.59564  ORF Transcript_29989/g.59564 Transcript_29989/m.59564 type:complete len:282 (+) Transcript_29989:2134-2979(+)
MVVPTTAACAMATPRAAEISLVGSSSLRSFSMAEVSPLVVTALSQRPWSLVSWATARSVISRASGSEMEEAFEVSAGRRRGRKGAESTGLSTSLDMLLIMTADWRLVAVFFSLRPRRRRGTVMASAGDSTDWTKVTPASSCMISGTSLGLVMAVTILPVMCSMSRLPMTSQAAVMALVAAVLTCFLVSHMQAVTSGTISGRAAPSCLGATVLNSVIMLRAASLVVHFFSTGRLAKMAGRRPFMAIGDTFLAKAMEQVEAAARTSGLLLEAAMRTDERQLTR